MTSSKLQHEFRDPGSEYRPMPLWVWNDELRWKRLKEQLTQFKKLGFGGVFVHPRPGLITEYLGREWFELWKKSLIHCKKLGMQCNIYDENSYPSGFAGGHVVSMAPETICQYVEMSIIPGRGDLAGSPLAVFRLTKRNGRIVKATDISALRSQKRVDGSPLMIFELRRSSASPWTGDLPYTDLTHPQTAKTFIATTHERYRQLFGKEFGKTITAAFADEPLIATDLVYAAGTRALLPLSHYTISEFYRRYGYALLPHLPSLFADVGEYRRVRFHYWQLLHDLWKENFMQPLGDWCGKHRLVLTGHYMEHEWPAPFITPDDMSLYACMQMPGIDLLLTTLLKPDRRYQGYSLINDDVQMLLTMRMLLSAVNQLAKSRALAEMWGAGGWDSTIEDYKRMGDWALAHGINFFNPHLSYVSVRGARKRDHPQSFSDHSPWWPEIKALNDRIARLSHILSQGAMENRILVLQPTTSAFLVAKPDDEAKAQFEKIRKAHGTLVQILCDSQIDFDLGDEYLLQEHGKAKRGQLAVGLATYNLVVIPASMTNMRHQTVSLLKKYLESGGKVLALSGPPQWVDGRRGGSAEKLQRRFSSQWHRVPGPRKLVRKIQRYFPPTVSFSSQPPKNFSHHMRRLEDGSSVHFFFNGSPRTVRTNALFRGEALELWNPDNGEIQPASFVVKKNNQVMTFLELSPTESKLYRLLPSQVHKPVSAIAARKKKDRVLRTGPVSVSPESLNVLVLDYCDVKYFDKLVKGVNTWRANWKIWQAHGFERPAWDSAVQYRKRILDRNQFGLGTGFEARFYFNVARGVDLASLELALECPELYEIKVNGKVVDFHGGTRWIDPHLMNTSISRMARFGRNEVLVIGRPFDVKMELENIYIRGKFNLEPRKSGFTIVRPRPLETGAWSTQGLPFYIGVMHYETTVTIPRTNREIVLQLPSWKGGAGTIRIDGKRIGSLSWMPFEIPITDFVSPGQHTIRVSIAGTPKNVFGPFHDPARSRNSAWPVMWSRFPENGPPPGTEYDIEKYGLFRTIRILIRQKDTTQPEE